jgi:hypothetical protein
MSALLDKLRNHLVCRTSFDLSLDSYLAAHHLWLAQYGPRPVPAVGPKPHGIPASSTPAPPNGSARRQSSQQLSDLKAPLRVRLHSSNARRMEIELRFTGSPDAVYDELIKLAIEVAAFFVPQCLAIFTARS